MKLVLYSGGQNASNRLLHQALSDLAGRGKRKTLTYIPFCSDGALTYFQRCVRRYRPFGISRFLLLPVDDPKLPPCQNAEMLRRALDGDIIYLAGGNTFYFLHHLRRTGMLPKLKRFAERGGVLAGLSAGALIMTPTIHLAGYPAHEADENEIGLRDFRALGLVPFEFYPHFHDGLKLHRALLRYSRRTTSPLYALRDGGGIVLDEQRLSILGQGVIYHDGRIIPLNET